MRRNVDLNVILFNNRIYGLTKGQFSPTSEMGKVTKSSPYGTTERPLNPIRVALAAGATFVARSIDRDTKHLEETLYRRPSTRASRSWRSTRTATSSMTARLPPFADKDVRQDKMVYLEHGEPLRFGKPSARMASASTASSREIVENAESDDGARCPRHCTHRRKTSRTSSRKWTTRTYPVPVGVFRDIEAPIFDQLVQGQVDSAVAKGRGSLEAILNAGETWVVD